MSESAIERESFEEKSVENQEVINTIARSISQMEGRSCRSPSLESRSPKHATGANKHYRCRIRRRRIFQFRSKEAPSGHLVGPFNNHQRSIENSTNNLHR